MEVLIKKIVEGWAGNFELNTHEFLVPWEMGRLYYNGKQKNYDLHNNRNFANLVKL